MKERETGLREWLVYGALLGAGITAFLLVRHLGQDLSAPAPAARAASAAARHDPQTLLHVLLALIAIIIASRTLGQVFRWIGQPPVIGEVLAGICLGPSLLGRVWPQAQVFLLPPDVAPYLGVLAQVGVILFMFLVGLELDTSLLRRRTHATIAVSHASIVVPFVLGAAMSLWLYPRFSTSDVPFTVFALFGGVAVSVTAFPVLARILTDRGMHRSNLGVVALTCAAVDDVTAWCLLAFVVGVANAQVDSAVWTAVLSLAFVAVMLLAVRPLVQRAVRAQELRGQVSQGAIAVVFVALLASTLATEWIGIHAIFGAFVLGAIIPHESRLARELTQKLEDVVVVLFLPAFFAFTGMRTEIGLLDSVQSWLVCGAIVLVASIGKFGGSFLAGRAVGMSARDAASVGILMNTRGLMELVVLNVGLDLGVISPTLFAMMVVMALVTTLATTPILHLLTRRDPALAGAKRPEA
ncbi:MAG: cation:proton antiporter [Sandaracinaceae bacterium]|nr:cation:proton antiporter [Sandaracinaceae bacterium]